VGEGYGWRVNSAFRECKYDVKFGGGDLRRGADSCRILAMSRRRLRSGSVFREEFREDFGRVRPPITLKTPVGAKE